MASRDYNLLLNVERHFNSFDVYDIHKAETGLVAFEKALAQRFDIILLDVYMPILGGIEAGQKIHDHYSKSSIEERKAAESNYSSSSSNKVFLIYAMAPKLDSSLKKKARKANFHDCLQIPLTYETISQILEDFVEELIAKEEDKDIQRGRDS